MGKRHDLKNKRFGRLVALTENPDKRTGNYIHWNCICDCGNVCVVASIRLVGDKTKSCGCLNKEATVKANTVHGMCHKKVYAIWSGMKERCYNPNNQAFYRYGGKGLLMEEGFRDDFLAFYAEVGDPPDEINSWSIDRIDNDLGYVKGNMRWATWTQQARNKKKRTNNSSGVTGVGRYSRKNHEYWLAFWVGDNGKRVSKCFNINKYGNDEAFRLACEYRAKKINELNENGAGYTEDHGK